MLVLGRVHVSSELVGGRPQLLLEAQIRALAALGLPALLPRSRHATSR